jgi:septal ring factor EnvC (AmiA/AmiB activator)
LAQQAQNIFELFKQNKFGEAVVVASQMLDTAKEHQSFIPNPSVIFFSLVRVLKKPEFRHCDADDMHKIIALLHAFAGLTLIEKIGKDQRLSEKEKTDLLEDIQTLQQMTEGGLNIELRFQLDCIKQCVVLMQDTGRSVIILSRAMGFIQQPMAMIPTIIQEVDNFPTSYYFRMLVTRQVLAKAKKDDQVCHELLSLGFQKKKTTDWHVFYDQAIMLGELAREGSSLDICCMAVTGNRADIEHHQVEIQIVEDVNIHRTPSMGGNLPLVSLTKLMDCDFLPKAKHNNWVKLKAIEEVLNTINCDKAEHEVRKEALMALLTRKVVENDPEVRKYVETALASLHRTNAFANWKSTIEQHSASLVKQIDTEWEELLTLKQTLYQKRTDLEERRRVISSSELELELLRETYQHDLENENYIEQVQMLEEFQSQQRQIEKQEKYATNSEEIQESIRKRVQITRAMSTMPRNLIDNVERTKMQIKNLESIINKSKQDIKDLSTEVEELKDKYEKDREEFENKRKNFETVQSDYHLGMMLQVQDLERKMNNIEKPVDIEEETIPESPANSAAWKPKSPGEAEVPILAPKRQSKKAKKAPILIDDSGMNSADVPNGFTCPITGDVMVNPVIVAESGHTYEMSAIQRWFASHDTDPMTGGKLTSKMLINNFNLKKIIEEWKRTNEL